MSKARVQEIARLIGGSTAEVVLAVRYVREKQRSMRLGGFLLIPSGRRVEARPCAA
jgi:hypothetical protein